MKIILSRKGFDGGTGDGEVPSPIFPDGKILSLPVPSDEKDSTCYENIRCHRGVGGKLGAIVADLTGDRAFAKKPAHFDPDLRKEALKRLPGWLPCFGQVGAAQGHLYNQKVGVDGLFLFYGWFHRVVKKDGHWAYDPDEPDIHALWGWLQVGEVCDIAKGQDVPCWARYHPHWRLFRFRKTFKRRNTLYIAKRRLDFLECAGNLPGGGVFPKFDKPLQLTADGKSRRNWKLPFWFAGPTALSYHGDKSRWKKTGAGVQLHSAYPGQEFVLDLDTPKRRDGAACWLKEIFEQASGSRSKSTLQDRMNDIQLTFVKK